ncbi:MAG: DUF6894 family protein [Xanthobacteraceae bacterium]
MPRYFFHFRCGQRIVSDSGAVVLADATAAREEAIGVARDFMRDRADRSDPRWRAWSIDVVDQVGAPEFSLSLAKLDLCDTSLFQSTSPRLERKARLERKDGSEAACVTPLLTFYVRACARSAEAQTVLNRRLELQLQQSMLVDRLRFAMRELGHELRVAHEGVQQSRQLATRSHSQREFLADHR